MSLYKVKGGLTAELVKDSEGRWGVPCVSAVKNLPASGGDPGHVGWIPGSGRFPAEGNGNPLQFMPGESHGQRNVSCCGPWGHTELETAEAAEHTAQQRRERR